MGDSAPVLPSEVSTGAAGVQVAPRGLWYLAMPGTRLKRGTTVHRTLLDEPVLIGRDRAGKVFAMRDICPHRAMPLSAGRFDGETVTCAYHGWQFGTDGVCRNIPSLVEEYRASVRLDRIGAKSIPAARRSTWSGSIWATARAPEKGICPQCRRSRRAAGPHRRDPGAGVPL